MKDCKPELPHVFCNFSWAFFRITTSHVCIRAKGHAGNHRCYCDARKGRERLAPGLSKPTYKGILR